MKYILQLIADMIISVVDSAINLKLINVAEEYICIGWTINETAHYYGYELN